MTVPYLLEFDADTGIYSFITANNIKYICRFKNVNARLSPLLGTFDIEIYDFDFYPEAKTADRNKFDEGICVTICDLFSLFFTADSRVLIYICDSSDDRHVGRNRLFNIWYTRYVAHLLTRIDLEVSMEDLTLLGCALVTNNFPHMGILQTELVGKIEGIVMEKFGIS